MKKTFIVLLLLLSCSRIGLAQPSLLLHEAEEKFDKGEELFNSQKYEHSAKMYLQAAIIFKSEKEIGRYLDCLTQSSRNLLSLSDYDSTIWLMKEVIEIAKAELGEVNASIAIAFNRLAYAYTDLGDYHRALEYDLKNYDLNLKMHGDTSLHTIKSYYNLAHSYNFLRRYDECISLCEKALDALEQSSIKNKTVLLSRFFFILGMAYANQWDYERALNYSLKGLDMTIEAYGELSEQTAKVYSDIASVIYSKKGDDENAFKFLRTGLQIILKLEVMPYDALSNAYINLGRLHRKNHQYDSALFYLQKADQLYQKLYPDHQHQITLKIDIAHVYEAQKLWDDAWYYLKQAEAIYFRQAAKNTESAANLYKHLGNHFNRRYEYEKALPYYQKGLDSLALRKPTKSDLYTEVALENYSSILEAVPLLQNKAWTLFDFYKENGEVKNLETAEAHFAVAVQGLDSIRTNLRESGSKQYLLEFHYELYAGLLESNLELYRLNNNKKNLEKAFWAAEQSRAKLLLENIVSGNITEFSGVPAGIINMEKNITSDIAFYNERLSDYDFRKNPENYPETDVWKASLFQLKREKDSLMAIIEEKYPQYFLTKYDLSTRSIFQIQQHLPEKTCLIEYFLHDSTLSAFIIGPGEIQSTSLKLEVSLDSLILNFRKSLSSSGLNNSTSRDFSRKARELYKILFEPVKNKLPRGTTKLIISPDGLLSLLPFDVLASSDSNSGGSLKPINYLLYDYEISYTPSATIWHSKPGNYKKEWSVQFAGYANSYANATFAVNRDLPLGDVQTQLTQLKYATMEVQKAFQYFSGSLFLDEKANESAFRTYGINSRILHLALHALVDDKNPMRSMLVFADSQNDSINDGFLNAYELYNMEITADLVVLSACNTGFGQVAKGEGVMSLSRAFAYAGSKSLVMSLWSANDQTTSTLMEYFYQGLKSGKSKDAALREAKLKYLKTADPLLAHPYYWGAFVISGDLQPIHSNRIITIVFWSGLLLLLLIAAFFILRKKVLKRRLNMKNLR